MTVTRKRRLVPTGYCCCGCGGEAAIGSWFVRGHDITSAAALRAVEGGLSLPQRLAAAGFGPDRSVVEEAVQHAGWERCPGCAYAGPPAGLSTHTRSGRCDALAPADPQEPAAKPPAGPRSGAAAPVVSPAAPPVRAEAGAAQGRLLPGADHPSWGEVPLELRRNLQWAAHALVTPVQGPLAKKENRRMLAAVRAAGRMRMNGAHWLLLLTAPRETLGSARSKRAKAVYEALERVVAQHTAPAAGPAPVQPAALPD
ncbi:hypothetical protein [Streptomyces nigrescens]|uniref:hypothetical protein n=1 Tax=Streptomyces nigrescens TaxID=1920 RepID=UPI0036FCAE3C